MSLLDGSVAAVDPVTGSQLWTLDTGPQLASSWTCPPAGGGGGGGAGADSAEGGECWAGSGVQVNRSWVELGGTGAKWSKG